MNGMAASDKIFRLLDLEETKPEITESFPSGHTIRCSGLSFSYEPDREILHSVDLTFPQGSFTALVGESGCGKSTLASILMGRNKGYTGSVSMGGVPLSSIQEESLLRNITYISHQSYLFKGTVRETELPSAGSPAPRSDPECRIFKSGTGAGYPAFGKSVQSFGRAVPAAGACKGAFA